LEEGEVVPTKHFRAELANESVTFEDAWIVLRSGSIYDEPEQDIKTGDWKYRIEGYEPEGKWMAIPDVQEHGAGTSRHDIFD
jgi:hypothetical protein